MDRSRPSAEARLWAIAGAPALPSRSNSEGDRQLRPPRASASPQGGQREPSPAIVVAEHHVGIELRDGTAQSFASSEAVEEELACPHAASGGDGAHDESSFQALPTPALLDREGRFDPS